MRAVLIALLIVPVFVVDLSSKDKVTKVPYQQMVARMRDAFDCGVVVEEYLHGSLKGRDDEYHKQRQAHNCDYVESVLNGAPPEEPK
jgi:hypothetical protein